MKRLNTIHSGDFLKKSALLKGHAFDVAIADPPYNIGKDFGNGSDSRPLDKYLEWSEQWIGICLKHLADHGVLYVYGFPEILARVAAKYPLDQQRWLVWHYTNKTVPGSKFWQRSHESILCLWNGKRPVLNVNLIREEYTEHYKKCIGRPRKDTKGRFSGKGRKTVYAGHKDGALPRDVIKTPPLSEDVIMVSALAGGAGRKQRWFLCRDCGNKAFPPDELSEHEGHDVIKHPTQKPMELTRRLMRSTISGKGKALIPFCGSGSECVVARGLGVDFFTTELNGDYVRLAKKWLALTKRGGGVKP